MVETLKNILNELNALFLCPNAKSKVHFLLWKCDYHLTPKLPPHKRSYPNEVERGKSLVFD